MREQDSFVLAILNQQKWHTLQDTSSGMRTQNPEKAWNYTEVINYTNNRGREVVDKEPERGALLGP